MSNDLPAAVPVRGLEELRETIVKFQAGTQPLSKRRDERLECAAIQGALAVVLAEIDKLREAALVPCPAVASPAWQPIETAPKDGTVVLGWSGVWSVGMPETVLWLDRAERSGWFTYAGHHRFMNQPTHWMPLPAPPLPAVRPQEEA